MRSARSAVILQILKEGREPDLFDNKQLSTAAISEWNVQQSTDDDEFEAFRKRKILAYCFRPNPLARRVELYARTAHTYTHTRTRTYVHCRTCDSYKIVLATNIHSDCRNDT